MAFSRIFDLFSLFMVYDASQFSITIWRMIFHRSNPFFRHRTSTLIAIHVLGTVLLAGCASSGFVDKSLELVGLMKKADQPSISDPSSAASANLQTLNGQVLGPSSQRQVALRIHAGQVLNTDASGRSLSLVVRIYKLRGTTQFMQTTYAMFAASNAEHPVDGDDVVSVKEVVLVPGQKYEVLEPLPREATHLAVVSLFRSPDSLRWRFVFDAKSAAKTGITLGAHGCAMSVAIGDAESVSPDALRLAGVRCG